MKKSFWFQIHWLLGIVLGVIIAIIGVTGAILSFRSEISSFINKDIVFVQPNGRTPLAVNELLEKVSIKMPDFKINSLTLASEPDKTAKISVTGANSTNMRGKIYHIDPYTAEILPDLRGEEFFMLMVKWHRWLGDYTIAGKQLVAAATVALIILSFTGLYLYFPLMKHKFLSSLTIDFKKKGRGFLYKLHSVFGIWTLIFVLLMSFTGLYWSYEWYRNGLYWLSGVEKPTMHRMLSNTNQTAQNASKNKIDVEITQTNGSKITTASIGTNEIYLAATQAYELFKETVNGDYTAATIMLSQYNGKLLTFNYYPLNPAHSRATNQLQINMEKNKVAQHSRYEDKKLGEKFMSSIFPLHSGDFFGITGLVLYCFSSLAMALFAITGYMLYYDRFVKNRKKAKRKDA
ncbi:MAG: PepSY domain-containing protein [Campylobacteraceae bacterium]|jgi:sulfite reductase (NADPH) flavoprotein alpha-component|nr:PepSY domain-containing protein [Campylobacteraceae bacterium]